MKSVYTYLNFRAFLADWYQHRKAGPSGFTYERFARLAGLKSPNYVKLIIEGKRNLTTANLHRLARAMRLSEGEWEFFEALVLSNQAKSPAEEKYYRRRLARLRKSTPKPGVRVEAQTLIEAWYYPAVTVGLSGLPAEEAPAILAKELGLARTEVAHVRDLLLREGLAELREGRIELRHDHYLKLDPSSARTAEKRFLAEQLRLSQRTFDTKYGAGAKFLSHTFTIDPDLFASYASRLNEFLGTITEESAREGGRHVVQLNAQFFSLSRS